MSKLICSLIVLFVFIFAGVDAPDYQAFAQQKNIVVKKKKKKQTAKRPINKQKNPEIVLIPELKLKESPYGVSSSLTFDPSDVSSTGGGQGTGTGMGSGQGSGRGAGIGTGTGSGVGTGNGQTTRKEPEIYRNPYAVKCANGGETTPLRIISKPKADYTEIGRQNQVNGMVRLRVLFNANGQIVSALPIKGLPYGLTEKAIAAAKQMRFEPAKKCGVPVSTTKVVEYAFNIY